MRFPLSPTTLLTALFLPVAASWAQSTTGDEEEEGKSTGIEVVALSDAGVIRDLHFETREGIQKLDIYSRGFAPPVSYKGPPRIIFFRPLEGGENFDENRKVVGQVDLPTGASRVMLLFKKSASAESETEESYRVFAFDNDLNRFPAGGYRFFNTADQSLICWLGENRFELGPDSQRIATADGDENGNVTLRIYQDREGELVRIYSSVWQIKDTRRTTVFLTPSDTRVQEVSVRKFVEPVLEER